MTPAQPVEMILARNLVSGIELPVFLIDDDGVVIFFNDPAGELLGRSFDEVGRLSRKEWNARFGPYTDEGDPVPSDELPLTAALRSGQPTHSRLRVRIRNGALVEVDVTALPLITVDGFKGALVVLSPDGSGAGA